jgi:serine protease Do
VAISSRGGGSDGVSFAIPINMARWAARQLQEHGTVRRGFLGVGIQALNKDLAAAFGTEVSQGALVTEVAPGSPAEAAKLQPGDVIKKFNGIPVRDPRHLQVLVERVGAGESCTLELIRNGESMTVTLTAAPRAVSADRPSPSERFEVSSALGASGSTSFEQGFRAASLNADLARELGFPIDARGVVVTAVDADSAAAAAGMEAGMRIVRVGARNIETLDDLKQALKDSRAEPRVRMLIETPTGRRWVVLRRS